MRRILVLGLLALPLLLATSTTARAQSCATGTCGFGLLSAFGGNNRTSPFGLSGFCFRAFGFLHQESPLFNYGPYSGYYPFEPYGPWTSNLQYTGPIGRQGTAACGPRGCGRLAGLFNRERGCDSCGGYALSTFRNVFSRLHPFSRFGCRSNLSSGCAANSCTAEPAVPVSGCVTER